MRKIKLEVDRLQRGHGENRDRSREPEPVIFIVQQTLSS